MPIRIGTEVPTTIVEESIAIGITVTGAGTIIDQSFCNYPVYYKKGIAYLSNMKAAPIIAVGTIAQRNEFAAEIPSCPNRERRID
jgi:hypothetical protein